jgi:hypothetical protein
MAGLVPAISIYWLSASTIGVAGTSPATTALMCVIQHDRKPLQGTDLGKTPRDATAGLGIAVAVRVSRHLIRVEVHPLILASGRYLLYV